MQHRISLAIIMAMSAPIAVSATELRAGMFRYDGGAASYVMPQNQQLICDDCPRTPPLVAAPPVITAGFVAIEKASPPPLPVEIFSQPIEAEPVPPCHKQNEPVATVLFRFDSSKLSEPEKIKLKQALKGVEVPVVVRVDAYTCRVGAKKYNQKLSNRRAKAVAAYLRKIGVNVSVVEGHGASKPLGGPLTKDRRAEVLIKEG